MGYILSGLQNKILNIIWKIQHTEITQQILGTNSV